MQAVPKPGSGSHLFIVMSLDSPSEGRAGFAQSLRDVPLGHYGSATFLQVNSIFGGKRSLRLLMPGLREQSRQARLVHTPATAAARAQAQLDSAVSRGEIVIPNSSRPLTRMPSVAPPQHLGSLTAPPGFLQLDKIGGAPLASTTPVARRSGVPHQASDKDLVVQATPTPSRFARDPPSPAALARALSQSYGGDADRATHMTQMTHMTHMTDATVASKAQMRVATWLSQSSAVGLDDDNDAAGDEDRAARRQAGEDEEEAGSRGDDATSEEDLDEEAAPAVAATAVRADTVPFACAHGCSGMATLRNSCAGVLRACRAPRAP